MKKSYLTKGIASALVGIAFLLAACFTESVFDGLLWGFAGATLAPGIGMLIMYFYWSLPENADRYREIQEQEDINLHDELNEKLRDRSGRIVYIIELYVFCASIIIFSILGKTGVITDHMIIVMYLFALLLFHIIIGNVMYYLLRKRY